MQIATMSFIWALFQLPASGKTGAFLPGDPQVVLAIVRLFVILAVLGIVVVGSMLALAELVEPELRDMTVSVQPGRFNK